VAETQDNQIVFARQIVSSCARHRSLIPVYMYICLNKYELFFFFSRVAGAAIPKSSHPFSPVLPILARLAVSSLQVGQLKQVANNFHLDTNNKLGASTS